MNTIKALQWLPIVLEQCQISTWPTRPPNFWCPPTTSQAPPSPSLCASATWSSFHSWDLLGSPLHRDFAYENVIFHALASLLSAHHSWFSGHSVVNSFYFPDWADQILTSYPLTAPYVSSFLSRTYYCCNYIAFCKIIWSILTPPRSYKFLRIGSPLQFLFPAQFLVLSSF